jgi:hypothetical protein
MEEKASLKFPAVSAGRRCLKVTLYPLPGEKQKMKMW